MMRKYGDYPLNCATNMSEAWLQYFLGIVRQNMTTMGA